MSIKTGQTHDAWLGKEAHLRASKPPRAAARAADTMPLGGCSCSQPTNAWLVGTAQAAHKATAGQAEGVSQVRTHEGE